MTTVLVRIAASFAAVAVCALLLHFMPFQTTAAAITPTKSPIRAPAVLLASPGRLEGRTETVEVGAAVDGIISSIAVHDGQRVRQGDIVATLSCADLETARQVVIAEAESLRQIRTRLMHGSREEERQAAAQKTAAARAVLEQATSKLERMAKLEEAAAVSRVTYEEARRDYEVAQADLKHAGRTEELVNAVPLREEIGRADADIAAAEQRVKLAEDRLSKCVVRAPIEGTILRTNLRPGESFSLLAPRPILTMADLSRRRVRAEVDERDVQTARKSQKVIVTSDASGPRRFAGQVLRVSPVMGRKAIITGDAAEKRDRDVLEVIAELEDAANELPVGLRVTVQFVP